MVGPFPGRYADAFKKLFDRADRFYVRDRVSLECAQAVVGRSETLKQAPDITLFAEDAVDPTPIPERTQVCLAPNSKIIEKNAASFDAYRGQIERVVQRVVDKRYSLSIVIHDTTGQDAGLVKELLRSPIIASANPTLFQADDPGDLKRHIAGSRFLVASRYHSIVASLSCGVPAIAFGWAHKYATLLEEFGQSGFNLDTNGPYPPLDNALDILCDDAGCAGCSEAITAKKREMSPISDAMWADVRRLLKIPAAPAQPQTRDSDE